MTPDVIDTTTSIGEDAVMRQRALLLADVGFSAACGVSFTVLSGGLAEWAGVPGWVVLALGLAILCHVGILLVGVVKEDRQAVVTRYAVVANVGWVVGAVVVLVTGLLPEAAAMLFGLLSGIVGLFGLLQWRTLGRGRQAA